MERRSLSVTCMTCLAPPSYPCIRTSDGLAMYDNHYRSEVPLGPHRHPDRAKVISGGGGGGGTLNITSHGKVISNITITKTSFTEGTSDMDKRIETLEERGRENLMLRGKVADSVSIEWSRRVSEKLAALEKARDPIFCQNEED